ncbi:MAG: RagB/SusD family nutrient uptake outer membrane protein [Bacteroidota bacterium]
MKSKNKYYNQASALIYKIKYVGATLLFGLSTLLHPGCKKLVEVAPPTTSINGGNVYNTDATAIAVITAFYAKLGQTTAGGFTGSGGISFLTGLSADELTLNSGISNITQVSYYRNSLSATAAGSEFWVTLYPYIYKCNDAIEGLNNSTTLTPTVKQQLLGEAKFMRACFYFYLINLYGDVPLVASTDYKINALLSRSATAQVYQQIIADLKEAQASLSANYLDGSLTGISSERERPTKWAATALLARVYLYTGDYFNAETQATTLINNSSFGLSLLNNAFLKASLGNKEAIWQLQPINTGHNTEDEWTFKLSNSPAGLNTTHPVYISSLLLNAFELGDNRKANWISSYTTTAIPITTYFYPSKYKSATLNAAVTEYLMVFRLGEQYLIRAEARAQQNNISGAQSDVNAIRTRAGLTNTTASTQPALLTAILHERQVELFTEFGHRWLDLKRTNNINAVMTVVTSQKANGAAWQSYQQLYPISLDEIQKDPNLVQNPGY